MEEPTKPISRRKHRLVRIFGKILLTLLGLLLLIFVAIQLPFVQNFAKNQTVNWLSKKTGSTVSIEHFRWKFPGDVALYGAKFNEPKGDQWFAVDTLSATVSISSLLDNTLQLRNVQLHGLDVHLVQNPDGNFNFNYLVDAFSTDTEKETSGEPFKFDIDRVHFKRWKFKFDSYVSHQQIDLAFDQFIATIAELDLVNSRFSIPNIAISQLVGSCKITGKNEVQESSETEKNSDSSSPISLAFGQIDLTHFGFTYEDQPAQTKLVANGDQLFAAVKQFDLGKQQIHLNKLSSKALSATMETFSKPSPSTASTSASPTGLPQIPMPWTIGITDLHLQTDQIEYHNTAISAISFGLDPQHLAIANLDLQVKDIEATPTHFTAGVQNLTLQMTDGWGIHLLSGQLYYGSGKVVLDELNLVTEKSHIQTSTSLEWLADTSLQSARIQSGFESTSIAISDLLYLHPDLKQQPVLANFSTSTLLLNTELQGTVGDLTIPTLQLTGLGQTRFSGKGRLRNLPDVDRLLIDLTLYDVETTASDLHRILPKGTLPSTLKLPPRMRLLGQLNGSLQNLKADLQLKTGWGNAKLKGFLATKGTTSYDLTANLQQLQLNRIMPTAQLGIVDGHARIVGNGTQLGQMETKANVWLNRFGFNGYTYHDVHLDAKLDRSDYSIQLVSKDTNAQVNMNSTGIFRNQLPAGALDLDVAYLDLQKLGFYSTPLRLRTKLQANILNLHPDSLQVDGYITHLAVANLARQVEMDSIQLEALTASGQSRVLIDAPFLRADASGAFRYDQLIKAITRTVNGYLEKPAVVAREEEIVPQQMDVKIVGRPHDFWYMVLPELTDMEPFEVQLAYTADNETDALVGAVKIPHVHLGAISVDQLQADIVGKDGQMAFAAQLDNFENEQLQVHQTEVEGTLAKGQMTFDVGIDDKDGKRQFQLGGQVDLTQPQTVVSLNPEGTILNYENWEVPAANRIEIGEKGILIHQLALLNGESGIQIQSLDPRPNAPISVSLNDFQLGALTDMVLKPSLQLNGLATGQIELRNLSEQLVFVGDLAINEIEFNQQAIGDLQVKATNESANRYDVEAALTGFENQVNVSGYYDAKQAAFDFSLAIEALQFATIERLAPTLLKDAKGKLIGNLTASGSPDQPQIVGDLGFQGVGFTVVPLDTYYEIAPQSVQFTPKGIAFNQFELRDKVNNDLTLNGWVYTTTYRDFAFDLSVQANNFQAIDAENTATSMYYGKLNLDSRLQVKGTLEAPLVNGTLTVNKGTDFAVVLPQSDPRIADREGIIVFVDKDGAETNEALFGVHHLQEQLNQSKALQGLDVNVNISVDEEAKLSLIIDKSSGDFLELKGEAELNGGIDPSGKTTLTGRYELKEGAYEMTFNFLKRKFDIQKGSYLVWTGEPTSATIDITAVYESLTSPLELLNHQLGNESATERNKYRQKLPFQTKLIMKGELLKPLISFDIDLPDKNYGVSADIVDATRTKLEQIRQDEAELNKQVFALLVLNRFVGENPFESTSSGFSAETMARQSVSKILSQQLNNMAADIIEGIELNFDLESSEDYTSGERQNRTDLNVELSKRLLDDRLTVSVGSSFGIEGEQQANQRANNIAGDISASYLITRDGRYAVRAYRKDEYQVAIQGQVIETGVAFIITMDYDKFVELFRRSREERKMIREENRRKEREALRKQELELEKQRQEELNKAKEKELKEQKQATDEAN